MNVFFIYKLTVKKLPYKVFLELVKTFKSINHINTSDFKNLLPSENQSQIDFLFKI